MIFDFDDLLFHSGCKLLIQNLVTFALYYRTYYSILLAAATGLKKERLTCSLIYGQRGQGKEDGQSDPRMRGQEAQQGPSPCIAEREKRPAISDQISIKTPNPKCRLFLKID